MPNFVDDNSLCSGDSDLSPLRGKRNPEPRSYPAATADVTTAAPISSVMISIARLLARWAAAETLECHHLRGAGNPDLGRKHSVTL